MFTFIFSILIFIAKAYIAYVIIKSLFKIFTSMISGPDQDWTDITFGRFERFLKKLRDRLYKKLEGKDKIN